MRGIFLIKCTYVELQCYDTVVLIWIFKKILHFNIKNENVQCVIPSSNRMHLMDKLGPPSKPGLH